MLTGKRAFEGDDVTDTLAAGDEARAGMVTHAAGMPLEPIRTLLRRCLEQGSSPCPLARHRDCALRDRRCAGAFGAESGSARQPRRTRASRLASVATSIAMAVCTAGRAALVHFTTEFGVGSLAISAPRGQLHRGSSFCEDVAIPPYGSACAFVAALAPHPAVSLDRWTSRSRLRCRQAPALPAARFSRLMEPGSALSRESTP